MLDGWDLTGTGTLRRSFGRNFPRGDVTGACQVLAPEAARRVHPSNYEAILNALVRRLAGGASTEAATPFAFAVYDLDREEAQTDRRTETTLDVQIRAGWWRKSQNSTAAPGSSSRPAGQGVGATGRRRRMGIASSSAWPPGPGRQSPNSTGQIIVSRLR